MDESNSHDDIEEVDRGRNPQVSAAAFVWLTQPPSKAVTTEPVIAIVEELLAALTHWRASDEEKLAVVRRAVRLLAAFVAGKETTRT